MASLVVITFCVCYCCNYVQIISANSHTSEISKENEQKRIEPTKNKAQNGNFNKERAKGRIEQ